jgi:hypothetical protein
MMLILRKKLCVPSHLPMDVVGYGGLKSKRVHNVSLSTLRLAFGIPLAGMT